MFRNGVIGWRAGKWVRVLENLKLAYEMLLVRDSCAWWSYLDRLSSVLVNIGCVGIGIAGLCVLYVVIWVVCVAHCWCFCVKCWTYVLGIT
jgi:hypothetical protein